MRMIALTDITVIEFNGQSTIARYKFEKQSTNDSYYIQDMSNKFIGKIDLSDYVVINKGGILLRIVHHDDLKNMNYLDNYDEVPLSRITGFKYE